MEKTLPTVVYTPDSQLLHPGRLARKMVQDLKNSRELAWRLFVRNIKAQYRQTLLGYFWAFSPPILTTLTWIFLKSARIIEIGETEIPYPVYVMTGFLLWQVFIEALKNPLQVVFSSKNMMAKINFPREALVLASVGELLFNFTIRFIVLAVLIVGLKIELPITVIFFPIGIFALIIMGLMFGLFLVPIGLLYGDAQRGLNVITSLWFFFTPIVYPTPMSFPANLITKINPVSSILITTRDWLLTGSVAQLPSFIFFGSAALILVIIAWCFYHIAMPHIIIRIGT